MSPSFYAPLLQPPLYCRPRPRSKPSAVAARHDHDVRPFPVGSGTRRARGSPSQGRRPSRHARLTPPGPSPARIQASSNAPAAGGGPPSQGPEHGRGDGPRVRVGEGRRRRGREKARRGGRPRADSRSKGVGAGGGPLSSAPRRPVVAALRSNPSAPARRTPPPSPDPLSSLRRRGGGGGGEEARFGLFDPSYLVWGVATVVLRAGEARSGLQSPRGASPAETKTGVTKGGGVGGGKRGTPRRDGDNGRVGRRRGLLRRRRRRGREGRGGRPRGTGRGRAGGPARVRGRRGDPDGAAARYPVALPEAAGHRRHPPPRWEGPRQRGSLDPSRRSCRGVENSLGAAAPVWDHKDASAGTVPPDPDDADVCANHRSPAGAFEACPSLGHSEPRPHVQRTFFTAPHTPTPERKRPTLPPDVDPMVIPYDHDV